MQQKKSFFFAYLFGVCMVFLVMNYKVFLEAMKLVHGIPMGDLDVIMSKPDSTNRKADQNWRKTCERNGIDSGPIGVMTNDPMQYHKNANAATGLAKAQARIDELEEELRKVKTQLALAKVINR